MSEAAMTFTIRPLEQGDLPLVKEFTDRWIGDGYYSPADLAEIFELSGLAGQMASLLAFNSENELVGVRLTYAPGAWATNARAITPKQWDVSPEHTSYFKSLFVAEKFQRMRIGSQLSEQSIEILKQMGTQAIICHSWLESPGNSSQRYLEKMGFVPINTHKEYWKEIEYECTRCAPSACLCTAIEMIKYL